MQQNPGYPQTPDAVAPQRGRLQIQMRRHKTPLWGRMASRAGR